MIHELLLFGTTWFWIALAIAFIAITVFIESLEDDTHSAVMANIVFWGFIILLYFTGNSEWFKGIISYAIQNPGTVILILSGYVVLGLIWSLAKWYLYLTNLKSYYKFKEIKVDGYRMNKFKASENKERILGWMMYWPMSISWTVINDPVRKIVMGIFNRFNGLFDRISDRITKDLEQK